MQYQICAFGLSSSKSRFEPFCLGLAQTKIVGSTIPATNKPIEYFMVLKVAQRNFSREKVDLVDMVDMQYMMDNMDMVGNMKHEICRRLLLLEVSGRHFRMDMVDLVGMLFIVDIVDIGQLGHGG